MQNHELIIFPAAENLAAARQACLSAGRHHAGALPLPVDHRRIHRLLPWCVSIVMVREPRTMVGKFTRFYVLFTVYSRAFKHSKINSRL